VADSRLILATLVLTPLTLRRHGAALRKLDWRSIMLIITSGIFLAIHFAAWVSSLEYTSVLISVVMVTTSPVWVGILEVFVLRLRLNSGIIIGIVITIVGSVLLALPQSGQGMSVGNTELIGGGLALLGAITFSVYMIIGSKMRDRLPLLAYLWGVYGTAAIVLLIAVAFTGASFTGHSTNAYILLLLITIFPQLIGHSSMNYALAYLSATYISVATQLEPIGSAVVAYFVLSETPTGLQIFGSAIILAGVLVATLNPVRRFREYRLRVALAADSV
jgi:drug/metabolite transporter (DMT)-like permease